MILDFLLLSKKFTVVNSIDFEFEIVKQTLSSWKRLNGFNFSIVEQKTLSTRGFWWFRFCIYRPHRDFSTRHSLHWNLLFVDHISLLKDTYGFWVFYSWTQESLCEKKLRLLRNFLLTKENHLHDCPYEIF